MSLWLLMAARVGAQAAPEVTSPSPPSDAVVLVEAAGRVEWAAPGTDDWLLARPGRVLPPGSRLRTGPESRATLQFSDRSVFRLNQSSVVEVQPREPDSRWRRLFLRVGALFFLDRERPARIRVETPTTTSAIRGTEFLLQVDEAQGITRLALLDGAVDFRSGDGTVNLATGQEAVSRPGSAPEVSPVLMANRLIQWCFYYPAVLDPDELKLSKAEVAPWAAAVSAYRRGDLTGALARVPPGAEAGSAGARVFLAGLRLSVGQVAGAEALLATIDGDAPLGHALREVIAATRFEAMPDWGKIETASEALARSYSLQSQSRLAEAWAAVQEAVERAPAWGAAWLRRAELEWSLGRRRQALGSLSEGRTRAPADPRGPLLEGFIRLEGGQWARARASFGRARELDGAMGDVWVGLGLCDAGEGRREEALRHFQVAVALEPQRAVLRAYLGKAFGTSGDGGAAARELELALRLDPRDPTGWLYRGLWRQQNHQFNGSVRDLESSVATNDGRQVYRSRLLLDQDRAMRRADLSVSYAAVGLDEVAERAASRAMLDSYTDFSAHLFRARTLQLREDPGRFDLRYESARQSELLVANLLAPAGGANLSQQLSQQDHLRAFEGGRLHGSTLTQYRSRGDWEQAATLYGTAGPVSYALDARYLSLAGDRPNAMREEAQVSLQTSVRLSLEDSLYLQGGYLRREGGDPSRLWDPETADRDYRFHEWEAPSLYLGYHREWSTGWHTLALVSHLANRLELHDPTAEVLFLRQRGGQPVGLSVDPFFGAEIESRFPLTSLELQQVWENDAQAVIVGGSWQFAETALTEELTRAVGGTVDASSVSPDTRWARGYAYYTFKGWEPLRLTAGLSYDGLVLPRNASWPPVGGGTRQVSQWSPKVGVVLRPWEGGQWRVAYSRGMEGPEFSGSVRLEPSELAGFTQFFRGLVPPSEVGVLSGQHQDTAAIGFDQSTRRGTYGGVSVEWRRSQGEREVGVVQNSSLVPVPDATGQLPQKVRFEEPTVSAYLAQMFGDRWAAGARYSVSRARLQTQFPTLASDLPGVALLSKDEEATLGHLQLFGVFNHESGFFARWASDWWGQSASGMAVPIPDEDFWQHHLWLGYRWPARQAELQLGVLNLGDQDYRLHPLNTYLEPARGRTWELSLRWNF